MKRLSQLLVIGVSLAILLSGCGNAKPLEETSPSDQVFEPTYSEPQSTPTPIPNIRAEAVLDETFSRYLIRVADGNPLITTEELIQLQAQRDLYLIDLRNPLVIRKGGFIPGAVSIPLRELGRKTSVLPDFTGLVAVYCEEEWQCVAARVGLEVYGWSINILDGGVNRWIAEERKLDQGQIPVPEVDPLQPAFPCCGIFDVSVDSESGLLLGEDAPDAALVAALDRMFDKTPSYRGEITASELKLELEKSTDLLLIDLRLSSAATTEGEIRAPNMLNIPLNKLIELRKQWPANPETDILVYDQEGNDAMIAMTILWTYGYHNVRSLEGGFAAWSALLDQ